MQPCDALDLALGGEALVETLGTQLAAELAGTGVHLLAAKIDETRKCSATYASMGGA